MSASRIPAAGRWWLAGLAALAVAAVSLVAATSASATPPGIPSTGTAQSELNGLTVADEGSMDGYDRDKFPHWIPIEGNCDTRETVLKRDGDGVTVGDDCYPSAGSWTSPYDGATWTEPADVDIDHVVPLAEAWRSGAADWTTDRRRDFANDLDDPQLIAVTDNVNQAKGDKDPASWKPPLKSYYCTYSKMWIHSKSVWKLTAQPDEKTALQSMLDTCS